MPDDDRFDKQLDLEKTEWRKAEEPEPFWGFNAKSVLIMLVVGLAATVLASWLVTGRFPYWFQALLEAGGLAN